MPNRCPLSRPLAVALLLAWAAVRAVAADPVLKVVSPEQTLALTLAGKDRAAQFVNFTNRYRHRDGSWRSLLWSARCDGEVWYAAAKDVTDRIWLERQALHDPLTKLPNRLLLMDRARQALTRLRRSNGPIAFASASRAKAYSSKTNASAAGTRRPVTYAASVRPRHTPKRIGWPACSRDDARRRCHSQSSGVRANANQRRTLKASKVRRIAGSSSSSSAATAMRSAGSVSARSVTVRDGRRMKPRFS